MLTLFDLVVSYLDPTQLFTVDLNDGSTRLINDEDDWAYRDPRYDFYRVINIYSYIDSDGSDKINIIIDNV